MTTDRGTFGTLLAVRREDRQRQAAEAATRRRDEDHRGARH